jgi:uncharacterized protein GlcG (DUF336 family)
MKPFKPLPATVFGLLICLGSVNADEHALFTTQSLTPETALKAVTAAMAKCRAEGYQVSVAVVDRMGSLQALIRDRFAGAHTPETARRKAWTAASFRTNTTDLVEPTQSGKAQLQLVRAWVQSGYPVHLMALPMTSALRLELRRLKKISRFNRQQPWFTAV